MADMQSRSPGRLWRVGTVLVVVGLGVLVLILAWPHPDKRRTANQESEPEAQCRQSEEAVRAGDYREALARADRAVRAAPDHAPGYARRARAKYFLGDDEGAL